MTSFGEEESKNGIPNEEYSVGDSSPFSLNSRFVAALPPSMSSSMAPLPFPINGTCHAGTEYIVQSIDDLYTLIPDIECVWNQALVPNKVPMGANYGRLLAFSNSAFLDYCIEFIYQGDWLMQTRCGPNYYNIGVLYFGGFHVSTGIWTISPLPSHFILPPGEHYDGRPGILMDFTVDVEHYCPMEGTLPTWKGPTLFSGGLSPFSTGTWPYRLFIDMLRAVGRDTDECLLLLGRTWMVDPMSPTKSVYTVLYFTLKTCDPEVLPDFKRSQPLDPLMETFSYDRQGVLEFFRRLNPVSFLMGDLLQTNPNGVYNYSHYGNTNTQPAAGGGKGPYPVDYYSTNFINSDPHKATANFSLQNQLKNLLTNTDIFNVQRWYNIFNGQWKT